jgi:hypothetical protein
VTVPSVSVVIPTYNRAQTIGRAVDSVLAQTYSDLEVIVVDDGSTDDTRQVLARYGDAIRYLYQENQERRVARNNGIRHACGEYIAFLDSDDLWLPDKLRRQVALLDQNPQVGLVYGQMFPIDPDGTWHLRATRCTGWGQPGPAMIFEQLVMRNLIPTPTVVARKRCFDHVGGFDPSLTCSEDWDLWLRIALHYEIAFMPEPLAGATFYPDIPARLDGYRSEENRIRILERAFDRLPEHMRHLSHLRPIALAQRHLSAAFLDYAQGRIVRARENFSTAVSLDGSLQRDTRQLIRSMIDHGFYFAGASARCRDVIPFVDTVLANLPPSAARLKGRRRQILAQIYQEDAFERYALRDMDQVRRDVVRATINDPSLLRNDGLVSIFTESIVGAAAMDWLRGAKRRLVGDSDGTPR